MRHTMNMSGAITREWFDKLLAAEMARTDTMVADYEYLVAAGAIRPEEESLLDYLQFCREADDYEGRGI